MLFFQGWDMIVRIGEIKKQIKTQFNIGMEEMDMTFTVRITLSLKKDDYGRGIRVFYKEIGAANEEQAQDFARQMLVGFLAEGVTVETEVVYE